MIASQSVEQPVVIENNAEQNETQDIFNKVQNDEEADESVNPRNNETSGEENVQRPNDDNGPAEGLNQNERTSNTTKFFRCHSPNCNKSFDTEQGLSVHRGKMHKTSPPELQTTNAE